MLVGLFGDVDDFMFRFGKPLRLKGFSVVITSNAQEFIDQRKRHDVAPVFSGADLDESVSADDFADKVVDFHKLGGGVFLAADAEPNTKHANLVLAKLGLGRGATHVEHRRRTNAPLLGKGIQRPSRQSLGDDWSEHSV